MEGGGGKHLHFGIKSTVLSCHCGTWNTHQKQDITSESHSCPCLPRVQQEFSFAVGRKYVPILKGYPVRYIYEPWTAPPHVQKASKCIIGKDYPVPMVNHEEASRVNMERMMQIYQSMSPKLREKLSSNPPIFQSLGVATQKLASNVRSHNHVHFQ